MGPHGFVTWSYQINPAQTQEGQQFSLLNPSISQDAVTDPSSGSSTLSFQGDFGVPGTGTPTIKFSSGGANFSSPQPGTYSASVSSTASGTISATIPSVDGQTLNSNTRTITLFAGNISGDQKQVGTGTATGTIDEHISGTVKIRADVESYFVYPSDVSPTMSSPGTGPNGEKTYLVSESRYDSYTGDGSGSITIQYFNAGMLESTDLRSLSGGGPIPIIGSGAIVNTSLSIPPDTSQLAYLQVNVGSPPFFTQTDTTTSADGTSSPPQKSMVAATISTEFFGKDDLLPIGLDSNYNVSGGSLDTGLFSLGSGPIMGENTLTYSFSTTSPPPTGTAR